MVCVVNGLVVVVIVYGYLFLGGCFLVIGLFCIVVFVYFGIFGFGIGVILDGFCVCVVGYVFDDDLV